MTRAILWALRGAALAAFIGFAAVILLNLDPSAWRITALTDFALESKNLVSMLISVLIQMAATVGTALSMILIPTSDPNQVWGTLAQAGQAYFETFGFGMIHTPQETMPFFLSSFYYLGFQLLLVVAVVAGILSFLRISGRLVTVCFISMIGIAMLGTAGGVINFIDGTTGYFGIYWTVAFLNSPLGDPLGFLTSQVFVISLIAYAYLEFSYQIVYFHSLLEPPTQRQEELQRQLTKLRADARTEVPVRPREIPIPAALQRMLGSDAFRLMRDVIEKRLLRRDWLTELKDVHEIRRLNSYVNHLLRVDPEAEAALTARAASPSLSKMVALALLSTAIRFVGIIIVAYLCFYPLVLLGGYAPAVITESVDFRFLPEKTLLLLLPLSLLFPLAATIISRIRQRTRRPTGSATGPASR
jgi:hypothetical protein